MFIRAAKLKADEDSSTPTAILEAILLGRFKVEATDGKTLIKTQANGQEVEFAVGRDLGPGEVMELAELSLQELERQDDPDNPVFNTRKIKKVRVNFGNAR